MSTETITRPTRKRLWTRAGGLCAFPGCNRELLEPTDDGRTDTVVGIECHIVAQRDHPSVARGLSSLTAQERDRHRRLIDQRHSFDNLVLMCAVHSAVIDDPAQGFTVDRVLEIKAAHEAEMNVRRRADLLAAASEPTGPSAATSPLIIDDIPAWERKTFRALVDAEPDVAAWLTAAVGQPAEPGRVAALIDAWPAQLDAASERLLHAVTRQAEGAGLWPQATRCWIAVADRRSEPADQADALARAAVDAGIAEDETARDRLLTRAAELDPDSPRVAVERLDHTRPPEWLLMRLEELATDDDALGSLIACEKALASLLLPDLEAARRHRVEAERLDGRTHAVQCVDLQLTIQAARLRLRDDQPLDLAALHKAGQDALVLRQAMIDMRRWGEASRLLMLVAEVPALLRDPAAARRVLERARPEEIATPDGVHVLGDAALRAQADDLALELCDQAVVEDDAVRRIRAAAHVSLPARGRRREALAELEDLAVGGGPEALMAAAARLQACLPPVKAPWHELSAKVVEQDARHARHAVGLRIMATAAAGEVVKAQQMADDLPDDAWAAEVRLRVAAVRGRPGDIRAAVRDVLRFAPDHSLRLLAARALTQAHGSDDVERAEEIARAVAHDPNGPPAIRADAFDLLVGILADDDRWQDADRQWHAWRALASEAFETGDVRISPWQVRLARHGGGRV